MTSQGTFNNMTQVKARSRSFDFLAREPDVYSAEDLRKKTRNRSYENLHERLTKLGADIEAIE